MTISSDHYIFGFDVVSCDTYATTFGLDGSSCASETDVDTLMTSESFYINSKFIK